MGITPPTHLTVHLLVTISNQTPHWFIDSMIPNNEMFLLLLTRKRKVPFVDPMIEDHPMQGNNNFLNGVNMSACINLNKLRFWPHALKPMFFSCCQVLTQLI